MAYGYNLLKMLSIFNTVLLASTAIVPGKAALNIDQITSLASLQNVTKVLHGVGAFQGLIIDAFQKDAARTAVAVAAAKFAPV